METRITKTKQLSLFLIAIFITVSCSKDDPIFSASVNQIEFEGQVIGLVQGALIDNSEANNASADFDIALSTPDLEILGYGAINGIGSAVYFDLNSNSEVAFTAGTYIFDTDRNPGTISEAFAQIGYDSSIPEEEKRVNFVGGQIVVAISNDEYAFTFTLNTSDGRTLTGFYKGTLTTLIN